MVQAFGLYRLCVRTCVFPLCFRGSGVGYSIDVFNGTRYGECGSNGEMARAWTYPIVNVLGRLMEFRAATRNVCSPEGRAGREKPSR